jgi:magnesium transporter
MKTCFDIKNGLITLASADKASICVFCGPDEQEIQEILETLRIDRYDLDSALDPDEISRVEFAPDRVSMIWKQPKQVSVSEALRFDVSSVGFFLQQSKLTMITGEDVSPFSAKDFHGVNSPIDVLLKYLFYTIRHYLGHLKAIKQITADLEAKISSSMENQYLLQMFALGESLTYYLTAIEANGAVLSKLSGRADKLGFSQQQMEFLDDTLLENKQCARQAQIYSTVLSGLMDARGTIINNNMSLLLKNLTLINVVFLPLNLIASIGGMSEFSMMTQGINWKVSYSLFSIAMILFGGVMWFVLVKYIARGQRIRISANKSVRR